MADGLATQGARAWQPLYWPSSGMFGLNTKGLTVLKVRAFSAVLNAAYWTAKCHSYLMVNTLRPRQNCRRFADDNFKRIFLNENVRISIKISLKFVPKGPINNNPALVQIMAWRRSGDKPLSEPMKVSLLTHICVTRPQWVKYMVREICCSMFAQCSGRWWLIDVRCWYPIGYKSSNQQIMLSPHVRN